MTTSQLTARLRGGGCGVLVGALAVAAHGSAGGGVPRSSDLALLLLVSLGAGVIASGPRGRSAAPMVRACAALLGGQWAGHFALSASLDHHDELFHLPGAPMVAAHTVAAFACAALILVAERLYLAASSVIAVVLGPPPTAVAVRVRRWADLVLAGPTGHPRGARCPRAPPLSA
ncbi:hypothetical protein ACFWM1_08200 [Nocardia sp. NPDC058379]|uniref:hypothetical protein n=1 Tax=unclassified Nocardia TaxID=2637762 RepID=UPI00364DAC56